MDVDLPRAILDARDTASRASMHALFSGDSFRPQENHRVRGNVLHPRGVGPFLTVQLARHQCYLRRPESARPPSSSSRAPIGYGMKANLRAKRGRKVTRYGDLECRGYANAEQLGVRWTNSQTVPHYCAGRLRLQSTGRGVRQRTLTLDRANRVHPWCLQHEPPVKSIDASVAPTGTHSTSIGWAEGGSDPLPRNDESCA